MESELQNVLIGIGVVVAILVAASAFAGTPMLVIPVFTGGVGAVVGALLGFAFFGGTGASTITGAVILGIVGFAAPIAWYLWNEEMRDRAQANQRLRQNR